MVYKSERNLEELPIDKNNNNLGPGEYNPYSLVKKFSINKQPFLTSSPRSILDIKDTPGPGAYYHDETHLNYLKNLQSEKISKQNDRINILTKEENGLLTKINFLLNTEKKGFNIKSKRFKIINNLDILPGPGKYFTENKNLGKNKLKQLKENENNYNKKFNIVKPSEFQRIPTIPAKNNIYGFEILDNGTLIQKQNPDMFKTFSGEKGDTVGPGSYEIEKPNNWLKTGTSWSKLRSVRDCNKSNKNEFSTSVATTNFSESKKNNSNKLTSKISGRYSKDLDDINIFELNDKDIIINTSKNNNIKKTNKKSVFNVVISNCKNNNNKKCKIVKTFESVIKKVTPGPGYYSTPKNITSFKVKSLPEYRQYFGSKLSRFSNTNDFKNSLGPGEYFKEEKNKNMNKTSSINFAPFSSKVERFFISDEKKNVPGPGDYDKENDLEKIKKISSSFDGKFGSNEKRFNDTNLKWKNSIPGPGFYIYEKDKNINLNKNNNKNNKKGKLYNTTKIDLERQDNIKVNNLVNDESKDEDNPPLGLYNPDIINSIDYKIKKKVYETRNSDVAFSSTFNKKKKKKSNIEINCEDSNLGPGYYYHEKKRKDNKLSPVFHLPEFKRNIYSNLNTNLGPGKYNLNSYNDWSKKSFNINYV